MPKQPDAVSIEDAYAAALVEVGRLQEQVILGRARIASLKREVARGQENVSNTGNDGGGDPAGDFSN
jgi:hypothetical protein